MSLLATEQPYQAAAAEKTPLLLTELNQLTRWHQQRCPEFAQLLQAQWPELASGKEASALAQLPYINVRLFKQSQLQSIAEHDIFKTLYSSGTSGQPSRIVLDKEAAALQSKILVKIMQHWLGKSRLPMLILDHPGVVKNRSSFSARGAGIQGLSFMGRDHCYALTDEMTLDLPAIQQFCAKHSAGPVLLFGFTFMVWQLFIQALQQQKVQIQLPKGILLHSGGWKKLIDQAVDNQYFKQQVLQNTGIKQVHNFYGMVEQIGAIFVECEQGHLHCPLYADVLVRRPGSWDLANIGEAGVLQLISALPRSYPGQSLLTEDRAILLGEDNCGCGRLGKYFQILGRLPQAEARGCSDTFSTSATTTNTTNTTNAIDPINLTISSEVTTP